jgi:hypothetical protein
MTARKRASEPFVQVPLWWIELAAKATKSPTTIVLIELLRLRWKTQRSTFPVPSSRLEKLGVSRKIKCRVLRDLERRHVISVEWSSRKTPIVTLIAL